MSFEQILEKEFVDLSADDQRQITEVLCQSMIAEWKRNDRKGIYARTQKMMAYNSNRIEGSTLTSEQTASLFDTGTLYSDGTMVYRAKDIEEMTGHFSMFNYMLKTIQEPLTQEMIRQYHYHLKAGVFEDMANGYPIGEYKNRVNFVSDITTEKPAAIPERMAELLQSCPGGKMCIEDIARFHALYEKIHPFQDGNGRTGRIILYRQCLTNGIIPVIIRDNDKAEYNHVLHTAQVDGDFTGLEQFFQKQQKVYFDELKHMLIGYERVVSTSQEPIVRISGKKKLI